VPVRFPARQSRDASEAIVRRHGLRAEQVVFAQQHPTGIDAGAFHSDVLSVGSRDAFLVHEYAFLDLPKLADALRERLGEELAIVVASDAELPLDDAVASYAFNSELVPLPDRTLAIVAPRESESNPRARAFLERVVSEPNRVERVEYVDVNDSMKNGGGPACLRLRVQLTAAERAIVPAGVFFDSALDARLTAIVERHYRDRLSFDDLRDAALLDDTRRALDEITTALGLGSIYEFQRP
jgi:succinylarginine dihydrolase